MSFFNFYTLTDHGYENCDALFADAGKIIIEKDKASIGMLQRVFKIGFNRAAHIMDQLYEAGVVGQEEGTKPRKILMSAEEFQLLVIEIATEKEEKNNSDQNNEPVLDIQDVENFLKDQFSIDADFTHDGDTLKNLKNIIIPSTTNENQIELINELLKYNSPITMKLILVDCSVINYSIYNGIPQLFIPVITDEKKAGAVIDWCYAEMQDRIKKFVDNRVKNIDSFNECVAENALPRIICIINEANDFLKYASEPLKRLFMNSSITGLYFILFSRFSLKSLSLGIIGELLENSTTDKLKMLLTQNESANDKQKITKNFDDMSGHQFERFCADVLKKNGFINIEVTQGSADHGIDILAEKDDITYAIQCKCYSSDIGNAAVQQAHTGKSIYHKDIAVVMTNRYFTAQAIKEAKILNVKLWDRDKLNRMIQD